MIYYITKEQLLKALYDKRTKDKPDISFAFYNSILYGDHNILKIDEGVYLQSYPTKGIILAESSDSVIMNNDFIIEDV